ncbi:MAG: hypothetical protein ACRYFS_12515 [Janthinobacterium lividum]
MFGNSNGTPAAAASNLPSAAEVAKLQSSLTQIIVSGQSSADLFVFLNGQPVPTGNVESLTVEIIAPDANGQNGSVTAILSQYSTGPTGTREQHGVSLFPGTVELIARGRRIVVTCEQDGSFDGLWLGLGMRSDGTSSELSGVGSLRLTVTPGLIDAKLVWSENNATEDLLPEA